MEGRNNVRSGAHRRRGGVTAACLAPRLSWLGGLEAAPGRVEGKIGGLSRTGSR